MPLDPGELEEMQTDMLEWMTDTCDILRSTYTAGRFSTAGSSTYGTVHANVPCRVRVWPFRPSEVDYEGQATSTRNWAVRVPAGTDVRNDDRIKYQTRVFHVISTIGAMSTEISQRLLCYETNAGVE